MEGSDSRITQIMPEKLKKQQQQQRRLEADEIKFAGVLETNL